MYAQLDSVEEIRTYNNRLWMKILQVAMENCPEKTRIILRQINLNDALITKTLKEMANED